MSANCKLEILLYKLLTRAMSFLFGSMLFFVKLLNKSRLFMDSRELPEKAL
jgi:hypothetical protein